MNYKKTIIYLILLLSFQLTAYANDTQANESREAIKLELIEELVTLHGFDEQYITAIFEEATYLPKIIDNISKPAEKTKTWDEYRGIFYTPARITAGVIFAKQHKTLLLKAAQETGVPMHIILGILGVETYFGRIQGNYKVIDSLYTLVTGYPPRSAFFKKELINLFYLAREQGIAIGEIKGSYAGAMGAAQFIPSSYRAYAVDGDNDGIIDLFENWNDIVMSIANYLQQNGWRRNEDIISQTSLDDEQLKTFASKALKPQYTIEILNNNGINFENNLNNDSLAQIILLEGDVKKTYVGFHNFYVITTYNRNVMYALSVIQVGRSIQSKTL